MVGRTVPEIVEEDPRLMEVLDTRSVPEVIAVAFGALVAVDIPLVIVADNSLAVLEPKILDIILPNGVELEEDGEVVLAAVEERSVEEPIIEVTPEMTEDNNPVDDALSEVIVAEADTPVPLRIVELGALDKSDVIDPITEDALVVAEKRSEDKTEVADPRSEVTDPRRELIPVRRPVDVGAEDPVAVGLIPVTGPVIPAVGNVLEVSDAKTELKSEVTPDTRDGIKSVAEAVFETLVLFKVPMTDGESVTPVPAADVVLVVSKSDVRDPTSDVTPDKRDDNKPAGVVVAADPLETPVAGPVIPAGVEEAVALRSVADTPVVAPIIPAEEAEAEAEAIESVREDEEVGRTSDVAEDTKEDTPPTKDESKSPEADDEAAPGLKIGAVPVEAPVIPEAVFEGAETPVDAPVIPATVVGAELSVVAVFDPEITEAAVDGPVTPAKVVSEETPVAGPEIPALEDAADESVGKTALVT